MQLAEKLEWNEYVKQAQFDDAGGQNEPTEFIVTGWGRLEVSISTGKPTKLQHKLQLLHNLLLMEANMLSLRFAFT